MKIPSTPASLARQISPTSSQRRAIEAPLLVDVGLSMVVTAATIIAISVATEPSSRPPDVIAYLLGIALGVVLVARRRWPLGVLIVSTAILLLYYSLTYPGIPPALPLAVALYTAVAAGHLRWGLPISGFFIVAGIVVVVIRKHEPFLPVLIQMANQAALFAVVLLLGEAIRNRRQYVEEVRERLRQADADTEREAARQVAEERLRIARDLHDVMAHTIAAISVQAGLAIDVLDDSPTEARVALNAIRAASREAMAEIKATVGVLRAGDDAAAPRAPAPTLDQIDGLIADARNAGLDVVVDVVGPARRLSAAVDTTAYRIVQESLTNVIRHAGATSAVVNLCYQSSAIEIKVSDNGTQTNAVANTTHREAAKPGHGLIGMIERASALGGWLRAGPQPGGGFLVHAWLPTEGASSA